MKQILVPTDFSENAANALRYALALAGNMGGSVLLMHAWNAVDTEFSNRKALFDDYNNAVEADLLKQLNDLKDEYSKLSGTEIVARLYNGRTREAISECVKNEGAELIVMGTRGAGGLKKLLIGSVTASVIGSATVPVLAIPEHAKWNGISGILMATREFEVSDRIFLPILTLAALGDSTVHVAVFTDALKKDVVDYLEHGRLLNAYQLSLPKKFKQTRFVTVHLEGKRFEETLEKYILENKIDILVMATHKRSFLGNMFNRSLTREMSYHSRIPLLAIPV